MLKLNLTVLTRNNKPRGKKLNQAYKVMVMKCKSEIAFWSLRGTNAGKSGEGALFPPSNPDQLHLLQSSGRGEVPQNLHKDDQEAICAFSYLTLLQSFRMV